MKTYQTACEALRAIRSGQRVYVQGSSATPMRLLEGIMGCNSSLTDIEFIHIHTEGPAHYASEEFAERFRVVNLFVGGNVRRRVDYDRIDYLPCFLSEIPQLFRSGTRAPDVALIHVSPPDANGYCSLGTAVDVTRAAIETSKLVIAQINRRMPRVHGDGFIHVDRIDAAIEVDEPLPEVIPPPIGEVEATIGRHVAELVEDGATLQMGIGAIPNAVLAELKNHRHLGIHTEMWSDGTLDLLLSGAVDNSKKVVYPGRTVSTFLMGSKRVYDYIHDNPAVVQIDVGYVNNPYVIARNPKVTAINSAIEVDLTGQICADSIGARIYSGVGGQMDFIRGASLSEGGKPIIAIPSRTRHGVSRLVPVLKEGAGVVTTRAHVHYVVTEYGIANLYGKTLGERAKMLVNLAHPDDREALARAWFERGQKRAKQGVA